jgi:hypothetical protein
MATEGTFILADIGGYTGFLTGVGIEHGKEITSHLFNGMLKVNRNRWKVGNIVGDCLFFYAEGREKPEALFDHLRALYGKFRGSVTDIAVRSTCRCGACARTSDLRLKFVVHSGEYDTQRIGGRTELIGPDVVVAHRLLKNSVPVPEYALLTSPMAGAAAGADAKAQQGRDTYDDIGAVDYVYVDLASIREQYEATSQTFIAESEAQIDVRAEVDAPADVVWQAMTDLSERKEWQPTLKDIAHIQGPSRALGEVHRCFHDDGSEMVHVTIGLDEAGRRVTEKIWDKTWMSALIKEMYATMEARALPDGTTEACFFGVMKPSIPLVSRAVMPVAVRMVRKLVRTDMEGLKAYCEARAAVGR